MTRRNFLLPVFCLGFALLTLIAGTQLTSAATATSRAPGNGLRISPVRTDVTINPGQTQVLNVTVNNITALDADFQAVVNDFVANPNESGDPALLLGADQFAPKHSLKRYVQPIANFSLHAGEQKSLTVTIKVPKDAPGGGYYGAVRFAPASAGGKDKTVTLAGSVGTLILVKVPGNIKDQMSIASFDIRKDKHSSSLYTSSKGLNAVVRFQNEGNIQEQPFGKVLLRDRGGKVLATYEVNNSNPRGNVLPDSIRQFSLPLDKVGSFGQFKVEGNFGYGNGGQLLSASTTFYVIPTALIEIFIGIVLLIAFLIFGLPRLLKGYNERVIAQARRRH